MSEVVQLQHLGLIPNPKCNTSKLERGSGGVFAFLLRVFWLGVLGVFGLFGVFGERGPGDPAFSFVTEAFAFAFRFGVDFAFGDGFGFGDVVAAAALAFAVAFGLPRGFGLAFAAVLTFPLGGLARDKSYSNRLEELDSISYALLNFWNSKVESIEPPCLSG